MAKDIVLICDDNYAMPTQVCIKSIISNLGRLSEYTIHVCTFGLTQANVDLFQTMSKGSIRVVVDTIPSDLLLEKIKQIAQRSHVTPAALIKFELPQLFKDVDSILYIDSDIIIKRDLSNLLSIDLTDYYIAASYEFWKYLENRMFNWGHDRFGFFFNSGVMLMNLKKMRDDSITEKLWYYKINLAKTTLMDQESLNAVCANAILPISIKWNFNPVFHSNTYIEDINRIYGEKYIDAEDLLNNISIIHYVGTDDKPWVYISARMRIYWDHYYRMLYPSKQLILKSGNLSNNSISFYKSLRIKYIKYGVWGLSSYIYFKLINKF